jgi:hypothetical protein
MAPPSLLAFVTFILRMGLRFTALLKNIGFAQELPPEPS